MTDSPPTFRQRLVASDLLPTLWTWVCGLGLPLCVYHEISPATWDADSVALTVICVILAAALGFVVALPSAWILLGPIYMEQAERNGAPFEIGDEVEILCGRRKGEVARVYKLSQFGVRLDLGTEAREAFKDTFGPSQVRRVAAEQPAKKP